MTLDNTSRVPAGLIRYRCPTCNTHIDALPGATVTCQRHTSRNRGPTPMPPDPTDDEEQP